MQPPAGALQRCWWPPRQPGHLAEGWGWQGTAAAQQAASDWRQAAEGQQPPAGKTGSCAQLPPPNRWQQGQPPEGLQLLPIQQKGLAICLSLPAESAPLPGSGGEPAAPGPAPAQTRSGHKYVCTQPDLDYSLRGVAAPSQSEWLHHSRVGGRGGLALEKVQKGSANKGANRVDTCDMAARSPAELYQAVSRRRARLVSALLALRPRCSQHSFTVACTLVLG